MADVSPALSAASARPLHWPAEDLWQAIAPIWPDFSVEILPEVDSSNSELLRRARAGRTEPTLLLAEYQSAGRGRQGKSWDSRRGVQPGATLMFSLGLPYQPADWSGLSLAVGLAVAQALHPAIHIKWPNDLWVDGRKLVGILIETTSLPGRSGPGAARYAVVGIGINIVRRDDTGLSVPPACVQELLPDLDAPAVLGRVVPPLVQTLRRFEAEGFEPFRAGFTQRDLLLGRTIRLSDGREGLGVGIGADGGLLVQLAGPDGGTGEQISVTSADISVRPVA
ncbi:MAG: Bifunctional ligase/repressor BirA [Paracidovorax wautersii]|uniref:Bifunctional ligase/repressor BirA n=1 Tax=Paracidovorax wautersii TaxID=1177982 RepID=A0A7V8FRU0_9BURK|nr:MAG: Bifunctional ligase/repressor BirA [Paracidovorax wautersii]